MRILKLTTYLIKIKWIIRLEMNQSVLVSSLISINEGGIKDFYETDLSIKLPDNGLYPNGDVVVSRIDINPSRIPNTDTLKSKYWIINNYGNNINFSNIETIKFSNFEELAVRGLPKKFKYFQRKPRFSDLGGYRVVFSPIRGHT